MFKKDKYVTAGNNCVACCRQMRHDSLHRCLKAYCRWPDGDHMWLKHVLDFYYEYTLI